MFYSCNRSPVLSLESASECRSTDFGRYDPSWILFTSESYDEHTDTCGV